LNSPAGQNPEPVGFFEPGIGEVVMANKPSLADTSAVSLVQAWAVLTQAVADRQPTGELVIPSGPNTNLFVRINPTDIPATIAIELLEAGLKKPITDISVTAEEKGAWRFTHERRLKKVKNWKDGVFAVKGSAPDELGKQMGAEFEAFLTNELGLDRSDEKAKGYFKGNVTQMVDACIAAGLDMNRDEALAEMKRRAEEVIRQRGEARKSVDISKVKITFGK